MTQQVASITCSHSRGLKAFQSRPVGALERKNLHKERFSNPVRNRSRLAAIKSSRDSD